MSSPQPSWKRSIAVTAGFLAVFATIHANWSYPVIRTASPAANAAMLLTAFLLPWLAAFRLRLLPARWPRTALFLSVLPFLVYSAVLTPAIASHISGVLKHGQDSSFEPIAEAAANGSLIRLYRTNGGATTSFGIAVWQVRAILPGLLIVRPLSGFYPANDGSIDVVDAEHVRIRVPPYGSDRSSEDEAVYRVRRWVYF